MNREQKHQLVKSLSEQFRTVRSMFLIDYKGLKVVDATELRRKIRDFDGSYIVVKNTLALRAAKQTDWSRLALTWKVRPPWHSIAGMLWAWPSS